jgi:hypothetical protein
MSSEESPKTQSTKTLLLHASHVAAAAAGAALLGWLSANQQQVVAAVPAHYQGMIATAIMLLVALKSRWGLGTGK